VHQQRLCALNISLQLDQQKAILRELGAAMQPAFAY
jgi:hypothetical protein